MAVISNYVAKNTHQGQMVTVKAKKFVWISVGKGEVRSYSDYDVDVAGAINVLGYSGDLNIQLQLVDKNPTAVSGPCILSLNTHTDPSATYQTKNGVLMVTAVFGDKKQSINIQPCNDGTQTECVLIGHLTQTVHLDPG
ncbi:MAG: hypothetical protein KA362_09075 [Chloroflexi bacterium]|nr:hypothetical protein [Chloroflexota bacterium]MBK6710222.1 hypothetical protein [Chloroflexota bacterium]MBK7920406.1 hypothetical protein [Chloroflexota bacterium]MBK8933405.1 hypothetical protein [Chloroflexota bacterium]MBP6804250.1 hypothetical protein [Chloroflexota bacterium]